MKCLLFLAGNETVCSLLLYLRQRFNFRVVQSYYSDIAHIFRYSDSCSFSQDTLILPGSCTAGKVSPAVHLIESLTSIPAVGVNPTAGEAEPHTW